MSKSFEINQTTIEKDYGKIVLYQRSDHKSPKWQARIKLNDSIGYIRKSTRTTSFTDAKQIAIKHYELLADNFRSTGSTQIKTFRETVEEWLGKSYKNPTIISEFRMRLEAYPVRFWGDKAINRITDADLDRFIVWRRKEGKKKKHPSEATIKRDLVPLKQVFEYAKRENYIKQRLIFKKIKAQKNKRPDFSEDEWGKVIQQLPEWVGKSKKNRRHYRDRFYLMQYILILGNTGIRPGSESQSLVWKSFQYVDIGNPPKKTLVITIPKGKVGSRKVVPHDSLWGHLTKLKEFRITELKGQDKEFNENEPIFCHEHGEVIKTFATGFRAFLKHYDLLLNLEGIARVPYSLRHTFATRMIRGGFNHWVLAKGMGTSVEHLEAYYVHDDPTQYADEFVNFKQPEHVATLDSFIEQQIAHESKSVSETPSNHSPKKDPLEKLTL